MLASSKKFFQNVYTAVNNRELGPKAYGVVEHFDAGLNANGVLVMAGGPGSDGPVELDWSRTPERGVDRRGICRRKLAGRFARN